MPGPNPSILRWRNACTTTSLRRGEFEVRVAGRVELGLNMSAQLVVRYAVSQPHGQRQAFDPFEKIFGVLAGGWICPFDTHKHRIGVGLEHRLRVIAMA